MKILVLAAISVPALAGAQAPRIGHLPVLDTMPTHIGMCTVISNDPALARQGITRAMRWATTYKNGYQSISLGFDAKQRPVLINARMGLSSGDYESESVVAYLKPDLTVTHGERYGRVGNKAATIKEVQADLRPADFVAVKRLATVLQRRCTPQQKPLALPARRP